MARPVKQTGASKSQIPIPNFWPFAFVSMDVVVELENEGWVNDGGNGAGAGNGVANGKGAAKGNGAGAGNGDAGMLFELGKNSRCDGAWVQVGLFVLPMRGFWFMTGKAGKRPGTADSDNVC